jgi:hypothetical protein
MTTATGVLLGFAAGIVFAELSRRLAAFLAQRALAKFIRELNKRGGK